MIVSFSNTSKPDVAGGLLRLSHQPPLRLPFIWPHSGKEDQVLYKIQRKKVISTQGGGLQVFSSISQAIYSKTALLTARRAVARCFTSEAVLVGAGGGYTQNHSLWQGRSCEFSCTKPSWEEPSGPQQGCAPTALPCPPFSLSLLCPSVPRQSLFFPYTVIPQVTIQQTTRAILLAAPLTPRPFWRPFWNPERRQGNRNSPESRAAALRRQGPRAMAALGESTFWSQTLEGRQRVCA